MPKKLFYIFFFSSHCPNFTFQVVKAFVFFHVMTTLQFHVVQGYEKFHILKFLPFPRTDKISFPRTDAPPSVGADHAVATALDLFQPQFHAQRINIGLLRALRKLASLPTSSPPHMGAVVVLPPSPRWGLAVFSSLASRSGPPPSLRYGICVPICVRDRRTQSPCSSNLILKN